MSELVPDGREAAFSRVAEWAAEDDHALERIDPRERWVFRERGRKRDCPIVTLPFPSEVVDSGEARAWASLALALSFRLNRRSWVEVYLGPIAGGAALGFGIGNLPELLSQGLVGAVFGVIVVVACAGFGILLPRGALRDTYEIAPLWRARADDFLARAAALDACGHGGRKGAEVDDAKRCGSFGPRPLSRRWRLSVRGIEGLSLTYEQRVRD